MILKMLAGIEKPDKGYIKLDDKILFDSDKKIDIKLSKYTNDLELYAMISTNQYDGYFSTDLNKEDRYSIFTKSNKFYLNDTKFYQVIETYLNLLRMMSFQTRKNLRKKI